MYVYMYIPSLQLHTIPTHNNLTRVGYICTINVSMYCTIHKCILLPWQQAYSNWNGFHGRCALCPRGGDPLISSLLACWTVLTICHTIPFVCAQTLDTAGLMHQRLARGKRQVMLYCLTSLQFLQVNRINEGTERRTPLLNCDLIENII